ncbi:MAG: hypothetical protein FK733_12000 [Asgard group archaeon]|nr:hypothetical protein [Asgard group archaeon]
MKKIFGFILIISLFFGVSFVNVQSADDYSILEGKTFVYDVVASSIKATVSGKHFSIEAFQLNEIQFSINNFLEMSYTSYDYPFVHFSLSCDGQDFNFAFIDSDIWKNVIFDYYMLQSYGIAILFQQAFENTGNLSTSPFAIGLDLKMMLYFVIANQTTWDQFQDLSIWYASLSLDDPENYVSFFSNSTYYELNDIAYFEGFLQTTDYTSGGHEGTANHGFLCAYNMTNGVLLGFKSKGFFDGKLYGDKTFCETELHIELVDYDLPDYSLFTETIDFTIVYIVTFGSFFFAIVIVVKRRKK